MQVELVYPGFKYTDPDKGSAVAEVRMTKTMYIIHPKDVRILHGKMKFGGGTPRRFRIKDGHEIGSSRHTRGWRITRELSEVTEHNEAAEALCPQTSRK